MDNLIIKKLRIEDIKEIEEVTELLYDWWGVVEGFSKEIVKELVISRSYDKDIPSVYVAKINNEVVGTISLLSNDIDFRQDLYPVVSSFIVKDSHRDMGIAKVLMNNLIKQYSNKFDNLYLATDLINFYEKFGFEYIETCKSYYNLKENKINYDRIYRKKLKDS